MIFSQEVTVSYCYKYVPIDYSTNEYRSSIIILDIYAIW